MIIDVSAFALPFLLFPAVSLFLRAAGARLRTPFPEVVVSFAFGVEASLFAGDGRGGLNVTLRLGSEVVLAGVVEDTVEIGGRELKYSRDLVGMVLFL